MRILIDVDGVVCDFVSGYLALVKRAGHPGDFTLADVTDWSFQKCLGLSYECVTEAHRLLFEPGIVRALSSLPGAYEGIAKLQKAGHELVFVTSPWIGHPTWAHERHQWIQERWPGAPVIHASKKHYVVGDVLVDDKPEHVADWQAAHPSGIGLLWDAPYNRYANTRRVLDWAGVEQEINR